MIKNNLIAHLLENSDRTVARWRNEDRKIVRFLDEYFTNQDISEFLKNGKISRLDRQDVNSNIINDYHIRFYDIFNQNIEVLKMFFSFMKLNEEKFEFAYEDTFISTYNSFLFIEYLMNNEVNSDFEQNINDEINSLLQYDHFFQYILSQYSVSFIDAFNDVSLTDSQHVFYTNVYKMLKNPENLSLHAIYARALVDS